MVSRPPAFTNSEKSLFDLIFFMIYLTFLLSLANKRKKHRDPLWPAAQRKEEGREKERDDKKLGFACMP